MSVAVLLAFMAISIDVPPKESVKSSEASTAVMYSKRPTIWLDAFGTGMVTVRPTLVASTGTVLYWSTSPAVKLPLAANVCVLAELNAVVDRLTSP